MEEWVGTLWHRLITRSSRRDHPAARVELAPLLPRLTPYYRALGGEPAVQLEAAAPRRLASRRSLLERVAGSGQRFALPWQDQRSLRLPPALALFPDPGLNEALYFWLTALAAEQGELTHWLADNQRATRELLRRCPGLRQTYRQLCQAALTLRPDPTVLPAAEAARETALRKALLQPGSVAALPAAPGAAMPVPLWLYPAPLRAAPDPGEEPVHDAAASAAHGSDNPARRSARRSEDRKETDGLLIFQLASLMSWAEQVELDRVQEEDDGDPGAAEDLDVITLARRRHAGAAKLKFDLDLPGADNDDLPVGPGIRLPEWDWRRGMLLADYCRVQPMLADNAAPAPLPAELQAPARALKRQFTALRPDPAWHWRQPQGEEIDLDAWLHAAAEPVRSAEQQDVYRARRRERRDLACLLLADLSLSTEAAISEQRRVIDSIREALLLFGEALNAARDPFAVYGFSSIKNSQVRYQLLKNFNEPWGDAPRGRVLAVKPGWYTRLGAAVRQSAAVLSTQGARQRLLLILSDGKPNDIDRYEGRYGIEDTRQAVLEARRQGLQPFCITIDHKGSDYLPYLFGESGFTVVDDPARLPRLLPKLYLNLTGGHA